ncbi:MAG: hypothetical protein LC105_09870 [Chitinophagales bacterium]|nr:hypothetical protein [Chitinophagales bacterium]MCZ2394153.1 hypothetical protein [Chitinophagales bacterium]
MIIVKIVVFVLILITLYFIGVLLLGIFSRYQPNKETALKINNKDALLSLEKDTLSIYTWNIGYAGLDKKSDFFYDGGKMMRPSKNQVEKNFQGIVKEISSWKDADIIFVQEVDVKSKRSYDLPEMEDLTTQIKHLPSSVFALNYKVKFVPRPIFEPMGHVSSGVLTMSKYQMDEAVRVAYPGKFSFPVNLFMLNRCFIVSRIPYKDKEIVLFNTHNSAFDGGILKAQEMEFLKPYLIAEYQKGNYVIAGGDWNQVYPGFVSNNIAQYDETPIPSPYPEEGWHWAMDTLNRTNRKVDTPYIKGVTYTTSFDFFLLSPNIQEISTATQVRNFEYSDHEPVKIIIKLQSPNISQIKK